MFLRNNHNILQLLGLESEKVIDSTDNNNFSQPDFFAECEFSIEDKGQINIANNNVQNERKVRIFFTVFKCVVSK